MRKSAFSFVLVLLFTIACSNMIRPWLFIANDFYPRLDARSESAPAALAQQLTCL